MKIIIKALKVGKLPERNNFCSATITNQATITLDNVDENAPWGWLFYQAYTMAQSQLDEQLNPENLYLILPGVNGEKHLSEATTQKVAIREHSKGAAVFEVNLYVYSSLYTGVKSIYDLEEGGSNAKVRAMNIAYMDFELEQVGNKVKELLEIKVSPCDKDIEVRKKAENIRRDLLMINQTLSANSRKCSLFDGTPAEEQMPRGKCGLAGDFEKFKSSL